MSADAPAGSPADHDERRAAVQAVEQELSALARRYRALITERARRVHPDLQPGEYKLFVTLARTGPLTPSALADQLDFARAQVSRGVRRLEELGLLERTADPQDRRSARLELTPQGRQRLGSVETLTAGGLHRAVETWPVERLTEFSVMLQDLSRSLRP